MPLAMKRLLCTSMLLRRNLDNPRLWCSVTTSIVLAYVVTGGGPAGAIFIPGVTGSTNCRGECPMPSIGIKGKAER